MYAAANVFTSHMDDALAHVLRHLNNMQPATSTLACSTEMVAGFFQSLHVETRSFITVFSVVLTASCTW
eukprot:1835279-Prorocentrum_lima.AAC.1